MSLIVVTPPAEAPVSLEELRAFLRVDHTDEDSLITSLGMAAAEYVSKATGRQLVEATYTLTLAGFPRRNGPLLLPRPPVLSVESATYTDRNGDEQSLVEATDYYLADAGDELGNLPALVPASTWPGTADHPEAVSITFKAGYGGPADVPHKLRLACMALTAHWYEQRTPVAISTSAEEVPHHVGRLMSSMRLWSLQ